MGSKTVKYHKFGNIKQKYAKLKRKTEDGRLIQNPMSLNIFTKIKRKELISM